MKKNKFVKDFSNIFCIYGVCIEGNCPDIVIDGTDPRCLETYIGDYGCDGIYLGRSWCDIRNNETGAQFKKDVENRIKKIFGKKVKCKTIYAEQYDEGL